MVLAHGRITDDMSLPGFGQNAWMDTAIFAATGVVLSVDSFPGRCFKLELRALLFEFSCFRITSRCVSQLSSCL